MSAWLVILGIVAVGVLVGLVSSGNPETTGAVIAVKTVAVPL
jgi:hypothetical protein